MQDIAVATDGSAAVQGAAHSSTGLDGSAREFLVFKLAREEYGVDILAVQELRGYENVTHIANAPAFFKGIINLRGSIVPIIDMRMKFAIDAPACDRFNVVVILDIDGHTVGMVVDSVVDVICLHPGDIRPAPEIAVAGSARHLHGIGTFQERMVILLDIVRLMSAGDIGLLAAPRA